MGYIALYRKYRPNTFSSIIGQESVTKILKKQIESGKISHAYIFSGTRGTGKTSAAKVFARAINCLNPKNGEPCNECEPCKNIIEGNITDVIEMDAASNNSVENIRQIRQEVVYATVDVKYRVYIIDEVHMLTTSAFNALLKTLEEPPKNVVFILATTEQHKIPITILSRCLKFEFNKLSEEDLYERIKFVLDSENVKYEDEACKYIAKLADGAARDALSILDRCISENHEILKYTDVQEIIGSIDKEIIENIIKNIINYESKKALEEFELVIKSGKDLRQFASSLVEGFLYKLMETEKDKDRIIRIIDRLSRLDNDLKLTTRGSIVVKACIVELCSVIDNDSINSSENNELSSVQIQKISALEKQIDELKSQISKMQTMITNSKPYVEDVEKPVVSIDNSKDKKSLKKLTKFKDFEILKKNMIAKGKIKIYSALAGTEIYVDDVIRIVTKNEFAYSILKADDNLEIVANIFVKELNITKNIVLELRNNNEESVSKIEKIFKDNEVVYTNLD